MCIYICTHIKYVCMYIYVYIYVYSRVYICVCTYTCEYIYIYISYLRVCLSVRLSACLSIFPSMYLSIYLSINLYATVCVYMRCISCIDTYNIHILGLDQDISNIPKARILYPVPQIYLKSMLATAARPSFVRPFQSESTDRFRAL